MSSTEKKSKESQLGNGSHKFKPDDVVLAKLRGFPAWPGIVMDDKNVPSAVLAERPIVKHRDQYTIRFFPAADYHWAFSKDLELLTTQKIDQWLSNPARKKGDLRKAYELARDPTAWNDEQNEIVHNFERSLQEAAEEEEENQDQLQDEEADEEADDDDVKEAGSKKRKRAPESGKIRESADKKQKKSKAAEASKSKPNPSANSEKPSSKTGSGGSASGMANGGKEEDEEEHLDPASKKVKEWRHKLQKIFLNKEGVVNPDEMPAADATFKTVEEYTGMTIDQLRQTKIGKVVKRIVHLPDIPHEDKYNFKDRAEKLCATWGAIMSGNPPPPAAPAAASASAAPTAAAAEGPTKTDSETVSASHPVSDTNSAPVATTTDKPEQDTKPPTTVADSSEDSAPAPDSVPAVST